MFAVREFRAPWLSPARDRLTLGALTLVVYARTRSPLLAAAAYAAGYLFQDGRGRSGHGGITSKLMSPGCRGCRRMRIDCLGLAVVGLPVRPLALVFRAEGP